MTETTFSGLGLAAPILTALDSGRYHSPTPIQAGAIPPLLAGRDLLGIAQTGTGKTAAFALPLLHLLSEARERPSRQGVRALVLAPTRELAVQIFESFAAYGRNLKLRRAVLVGGVAQGPQRSALAQGVDILVATPGRLLDHMEQGNVHLQSVRHLVLDEADRMLDMGFIRDVRKIVAALPKGRQSVLFSATMPADVGTLARDMLKDPVRIEVTPKVVTVERIHQRVHHVAQGGKPALLVGLLGDPAYRRVIVFTRTKRGANRVAETLGKAGIAADAIHGNKSQNARQGALERFRNGKARVLVATDIAARGLHVSEVSHVINYELPSEPETYVHRIGRTARAGAAGEAISFCDAGELGALRDIERLTGRSMEAVGEAAKAPPRAAKSPVKTPARAGRPRRRFHRAAAA
ncbi:MAG: DEAD/DEAH box helicase [Alphaproteobacteria bacterium]|nr:DEAD/DEAH box helicase [Alphaproteobacteria bacterium]